MYIHNDIIVQRIISIIIFKQIFIIVPLQERVTNRDPKVCYHQEADIDNYFDENFQQRAGKWLSGKECLLGKNYDLSLNP